ncbi:TetR/AcrR family transcriptional regulator [Trinickia acidisoli]|uniref:TetR/AcrR family transcriptional regulator n=1 Tax=Trinickia acidisoli TaxID=2767482 RepID=UPI001A8EEF0C|nr:TetR/AcrR family transcriptional regulator [Trinickia acidisoli]
MTIVNIDALYGMHTSANSFEKHTYHHGDLKRALRATASTLMEERGVHAVSLREIAQAAGVSHTAVYRHYADKEALLADLAESGFRELHETMQRAVRAAKSGPVRQLQAIGLAYVRYGVRQPHVLQLMFGGIIADRQSYPSLIEAGDALARVLADVVKAGQSAGVFRSTKTEDLTLTAWSLVHGLTLLICGGQVRGAQQPALVERAARRSVALLIEGLMRTER